MPSVFQSCSASAFVDDPLFDYMVRREPDEPPGALIMWSFLTPFGDTFPAEPFSDQQEQVHRGSAFSIAISLIVSRAYR